MASSMAFRSLYMCDNPPKLLSRFFFGSRQSMLLKPLVSTGNATRLLKLHPGFGISKFPTTIDGTIERGICSVGCYHSGADSGENPNQHKELTIDEVTGLILIQGIATAAALGVLFSLTRYFRHREDLFRYDLREPFNLRKGWLLWAGIGFIGAIGAIALTVVALSYFGWLPERETADMVILLALIGASPVRTACLVGTIGILAPIFEEIMFRGFLMVSLTRWVPTPVAIAISSAVFALAHRRPKRFLDLFVSGTTLGISYAQTRNLLTPITIHVLWNSGMIILFLAFLQLHGGDIKKLLQAKKMTRVVPM